MTGYTVHTGSTESFSEGWDNIFGSGKKPQPKKSSSNSGAKRQKQGTSAQSAAAKKRSKDKK